MARQFPDSFGGKLLYGLSSKKNFVTFWKWLYYYCCIGFSRRFTKKRFDIYDMEAHHDPIKTGFLTPQIEIDVESPQPESHLLHAADEVFVYGVNSSSECLVVRIARSVNNEAEAWIYMKLKDGKIYKLTKTSGYQQSCSDAGKEFTCGGLKMHYNSPMRSWRIFYNGLLRETSEENHGSGEMVYIKFALIWRASSDLFDMKCDVSGSALALGFAKNEWKSCKPPMEKLNDALNFYAQSGVIFGTVSVDGESTDRHLYLFGERIRFLGDTCLGNGAQFTHILGQIFKNGTIVHISEVTVPGIVKRLRFGFLVLPTGVVTPISDPDLQLQNISAAENEDIAAVFHAEGKEYKLKGTLDFNFESNNGCDGLFDSLIIQMNGLEGSGILIKWTTLKSPVRSVSEVHLAEIQKEIPFVVHFSDELCGISDITGGKGSSLGKLTELSKKFQDFRVADGIVVTTSAYKSFVSKEILKEISCLEDILYGNVLGDVKEACQRVMDEVITTNIPEAVYQTVVKCLQGTFGEQLHAKKFAIRSSATGEDTEQMSAAGQMETFLGVTGLNEIVSSVKKCWASQFGFIAVQYKRQNGQEINSPMAVVIQEMVPCDVAGVLFTCDPLTGNPTLMSITANYGLGESVVSGSEEPDTITLERDEEDKLKIKNKIIGAKSHRTVIKDDEGTSLEEVAENEKKSCCVSDAMALHLGSMAVQIEKSYRSNRDIEWGFWNNDLYIFQSRPITSGTGETDYEIDHGTDGPMRIENEYFTMCNVGEVMPGAISPLSLDVFYRHSLIAFQRSRVVEYQSSIRPKYYPRGLGYMFQHLVFYVLELLDKIQEGREVTEASMIGLFGRILDDNEIYEAAIERYGGTKKEIDVFKNFRIMKSMFFTGRSLEKTRKLYANYHLAVEKMKNSKEVFDTLVHACDELVEALLCHMLCTQSSTIWNIIIISILRKDTGGLSPKVYSNFAKLLASIGGVESADVPCAMQSLAFHIGKEVNPEDFKKMDLDEITQWLNTSPTEAGKKFRDFLDTHGHRCLREMDIKSVTWRENPKLLIQLLQNFVGNVSEDASPKVVEDTDQMLSNSGVSFIMKHFLLPQCRKAVKIREASKSLFVKLTDDWRQAYKYLAKLMVSEGRIPDEDLLFFFNLDELNELLNNRSPKIIARAKHRRRRYPELDRLIFPEIHKGILKPINVDDQPIVPNEENFQMQGIPVSQGVAKGFVRVALTLEEAAHLKHGEILLTYSTDIGWSPYFPSLAGVVTELGGLISHGAVVSREYGLPCIAGLHGATRQFVTGDYVLLDGNRGILQKLAPPQLFQKTLI